MQNVWIVANSNLIEQVNYAENREILKWLSNRHIKNINNNENGLALIMEINNYIIIEVSEHGNACYIYSKNYYYYHKILELIKNKRIYGISVLKDTSVIIINAYYYQPNIIAGKLIHSSDWEYKFKQILEKYIGV